MSGQLDDPGFVTRLDPSGMYGLTSSFPAQVARALEISVKARQDLPLARPAQVVLTGMGGSAAGGDFAAGLFEDFGSVPFLVNRDYALPRWVGQDTLVLATSYSGNTEETLAAYDDARRKGAAIFCVTSGGQLAAKAQSDGVPLVLIPGGQPPRTALAYLFVPVVDACERSGLLPRQDWDAAVACLEACVRDWGVDVPTSANPTKQLAHTLFGKVSVTYGLGSWQGRVAGRWKGQVCENAKNLTFAHTYPELCHNEVLGWVKAGSQGVSSWVSVVLTDGAESAKMKKRAEVTARLIRDVATTVTVQARGQNLLEKMLSLTLFGDFVSIYLAALNGVDPENIDSINILKAELAQVP